MKIDNIELQSNIILAPLAGYTNVVFRNIAREMGAGLCVSEMISDKGLLYGNEKTELMASGKDDNGLVSIQLFGGEIKDMVKAAMLVDKEMKCDIIDINMGCPVRKVIKAKAGSYLLQDVQYAKEMVRRIVDNVSKPVTVKIRLGFDHEHINCVEMAKAMEEAGASAIFVHGRCKSDMYSGKVNLDYIKKVKEAVGIPVIGNGDIKSYEDAKHMMEYTGCDGVMIGRGTLGNPWLIKEINCKMRGMDYTPPTKKMRVEMLLRYIDELVELKGEKIGILEMRAIACWYVKGFKGLKPFKEKAIYVKTKQELLDLIDELVETQGDDYE